MKQGERLAHVFTIHNTGTRPLTILRIDLSVPGTRTRFRKTIPAGESGPITMEWDTSSVRGEFEAAAMVLFADSRQPGIELRLAANVRAAIEVVPFPEMFFSAYRGETPERVVQIVNNEERPLSIVGVESPSAHYRVTVDTVRDGFSYDVRVQVQPDVPFGRYVSEPIYLRTDNPARPRLQLFANLFVKPDFYAAADEVDFGMINLEALIEDPRRALRLTQSVTLANRQGPIEIARIETDLPALRIRQTPAAGGSERHRLEIALVPDKLQRGALSGTIRVVPATPAGEAVSIPVRGEVR